MSVSGQLHAPAALYPGKEPLGAPQRRSGHGGEEKNSQPLPGLEPPIIQSVAQRYTTELSLFLILDRILGKLGGGGDEWMRLAQDRDQWRDLVNRVMNFRVSGWGFLD
jgi:hypothetical protein